MATPSSLILMLGLGPFIFLNISCTMNFSLLVLLCIIYSAPAFTYVYDKIIIAVAFVDKQEYKNVLPLLNEYLLQKFLFSEALINGRYSISPPTPWNVLTYCKAVSPGWRTCCTTIIWFK